MSTFGKILGTIALLLVALAGLSMSLCGGVFTVTSLGEHEMSGALVISLPSLAIGLWLLWIAGKRLRALFGRRPDG